MAVHTQVLHFSSKGNTDIIDITDEVEAVVQKSDVRSGIESSAQQARDAVKKLTGADKPAKAEKSDSTAKPKAKAKTKDAA